MSRHSSLKSNDNITVKRSVLKRFERIDLLKKTGKLKAGQKVWGLPKTKVAV
ncbi:MAG: small basic protein [bacterium]